MSRDELIEKLSKSLDSFLEKGGAGSGHWGHAGRIGERGGSVTGTGAGVRVYTAKEQLKKEPEQVLSEIKGELDTLHRKYEAQYSRVQKHEEKYNSFSPELESIHDKLIDRIDKKGDVPLHEDPEAKVLLKQYDKISKKQERELKKMTEIKKNANKTMMQKRDVIKRHLVMNDGSEKYAGVKKRSALGGFKDIPVAFQVGVQNRAKETVSGVNRMMNPELAENVEQALGGNLAISYNGNSRHRAYAQPKWQRDPESPTGYSSSGGQFIEIGQSAKEGTIAHEYGHLIAATNPYLQKDIINFYKIRTFNEPERSMNDITGKKIYSQTEKAKVDDFMIPYMGKVYRDPMNGNIIDTEIMSMGLEQLYDGNNDFLNKDPEYAGFIISALQGKSEQYIQQMAEKRGVDLNEL